ncbi:MAG: hypothetical protein ACYC99_16835 [Candidatus Geothermincolia bacterium]
MAEDGLFKEDAERLAAQIVDENPMVDILEIRMDPELGGYIIQAYDYGADEEFTVDRVETWNAKRSQHIETHITHGLSGKVHEKRGRKVGSVMGHWVEVRPDDWPEDICDAVEERRFPGEALVELEPSLADAEVIYPGEGRPEDYGFDGNYLVLVGKDDAKVYRQIIKLANFTLLDQSEHVKDWRALGFDISPQPEAPLVEPGSDEWSEDDVVEEVKDRLLGLSDRGYGAILVDGQVNTMAYAWVLAGVLGLKVITAWEQRGETALSGFAGMGFAELLHYKEVEELL